jgi:tetratricopeptide (TPR) repeat protein
LRQDQESDRYQELLDLALSWYYHLLHGGEYHAAVQISRAVVPVLHRLGLRDLAGELLKQAISAAEGYDKALSMDDLAKIHVADGQLAGALNVYDEVYKALLLHGTDIQRAHVLTRSARVQQQMGLLNDAIQKYKQALRMMREAGDQRGQALCLYQLALIFKEQENRQQALVYSQAAKELYTKLLDDRGLALAAYEQGHILSEMEHLDGALENFAESMRLCRRLGDLNCVANNLFEIGNVLHKLGKTEMAIRTLEEAEGVYEMLDVTKQAEVQHLLETLYDKQQRLTDAVQRFRKAKRSSVNRRRNLNQ